MKFSLSMLPFIDKEIEMRLFELIRESGIENLELFAQRPHCDITKDFCSEMILKVEREMGLRINSVHLPIYFNRIPEVTERKKINLSSSDNNLR
ncbi:MAG: hypothetical protein N3B13_12750, partial [Deltaproteobacteria bacterium]|nr:hypothetical protein [Deltaproteobacteria bacterium]